MSNLTATVITEQEPDGCGSVADVTTLFLTASRCPIGCTMCDLHHNMLPHATPSGEITRQITDALAAHPPTKSFASSEQWIKLYNSGNFFDPASIPVDEYDAIARLCDPFERVIIENHPRFGAKRLLQFRDSVCGKLEVAVGLETVQPRWLNRLKKQMTRDQFDQYASYLKQAGVDLRVFLIVGVPGITVSESLRWARLSIRHAARQSARHISLIPARAGHGWSGQAHRLPPLKIADLHELQQSALNEVPPECLVTVDHWGMP